LLFVAEQRRNSTVIVVFNTYGFDTFDPEEANMTINWLFTSAVVVALATPAWAQTTTDQPTTTAPPPAATSQPTTQPEGTAGTAPQPAQPEATTAPAAGTTGPEQTIIPEQKETQVLAEDLVGAKVFGPDGEKVGTVEDLILDEQKKVTGVVVGVGGFLGMGKKEVGLNWEQAKVVDSPDTATKKIMISLTKADLEAAPDFKTKAEREAEEQAAAQQQQLQQQQQQQQQQAVPPAQPSQ
jgi:sporulation protein YlmC with PRC-barrel domain